MTNEMVACIAIEALSILEKIHSRGYDSIAMNIVSLIFCANASFEMPSVFFCLLFQYVPQWLHV